MPDDGDYPTQKQLEHILDFEGTPANFIDYISSIWWYNGFKVTNSRDTFRRPVKRATLSTWGWSGNEEIITTLKQTWFWFLWWQKSERGGHYMFEIPTHQFNKDFGQEMGLPDSRVDE